MNRRHFLGATAFAAFPYHLFAADKKKFASDRVKLGPHKIEISQLAMGTGTHGGGGSSDASVRG